MKLKLSHSSSSSMLEKSSGLLLSLELLRFSIVVSSTNPSD